jgi:YbbR domain-containing protein
VTSIDRKTGLLLDTFVRRTARTRWRRFVEQINTLALSILLAVIVWVIAINQENPIVQATYSERLPVTVRGLPENLLPIQDLSRETVQVVLQAPQESWENLEASDFTAYIDLTGLEPGVHDVEVDVDVVDPRVVVVSTQRPALRVQLDEVISKDVPVRVDIVDTTAYGYDWQAPLVEPMTVTVTGPETQVDQVTTARVEVSLGNAKSQVERDQPVTLLNAEGQVVPRVTANPTIVHVVVPVEQWPGRKEVAVRVNLVGQPAAGYRLSSVRVNPSTVVLLGNADVLSQVPGFVETEPVSLADATGEIQVRVQVMLPQGVTVLEGTAVDVTASITPIEGGTTVQQRPVIQGLGPGLEATVALETVDVILSGPLPFLEALGPDDVFVIVDLTGLLAGNHVVTPRVVVPTGIQAAGVIPETVEVVITAVTAPTIGPLPVITGTVTPLPDTVATPTLSGTPAITATIPATAESPLSTPVPTPEPGASPARIPTRTPVGTPVRTPVGTPTLAP